MSPVAYAWVIPALPLLALVIIFCVTRPLDVAAQRRAGLRPSGGGGAHGRSHAHDVDPVADTHSEASGGDVGVDDHGHGGHGGQTTFWGLAGSVIGVAAMLIAFAIAVAILFQFLDLPVRFLPIFAT